MNSSFFENENNKKNEYTKVRFNDFDFLETIKENDKIFIDIETTGLKPHKKGHRIVCLGITKEKETVVFNEFNNRIFEILADKDIGKIAHNLPFEANWIKVIWGFWVQNWVWDTMLCAHIINNVGSIGLKDLVLENFKVEDYDFKVKNFLKAKYSNDFNRIDEIFIDDLMEYCGYDTYFTRKIYLKQKNILKKDPLLQKGFDFFLKGIQHFAYIQNNGFCFDMKKYKQNYSELVIKINELEKKIKKSPELLKLENKEDFNHKSSKQLRNLFFDVLKIDSIKKTKKDFECVDAEVLSKINLEIAKNITEYRHVSKIKDTYLKQYRREAVEIDGDYYFFPFFSLTSVATYRSSCYNPNIQNTPIRDQFAKLMTRSCLIPRKNRRLLEIDFKGMEVAIGCCYHKDRNMINYVKDKRNNMHTDTASLIFMLPKEEVTKEIRFFAKNGFVFPSFYGSTSRMYNQQLQDQGYGELTLNLWEMLDFHTKEHLKNKKIKNIFQFQKHVQKVEEYFWGDLFSEYQQWKFDNWNDYKEKGFVELYTGFRCSGKMSFNQVNNFRIQGTAFHVLLWCFIEINEFLMKNKMQSMLIGQVHDSILFDIVDEEIFELKKIIKEICTKKVREFFKWVIVPLEIEAEITGINESWNLKKEYKL